MTKLSSDPTQSKFISNKYEKDLKTGMRQYVEGIIALSNKHKTDPKKMREEIDTFKAGMMNDTFRPMVEKYVGMSVAQGARFADLQMKRRR